jgi:hypothetical protein
MMVLAGSVRPGAETAPLAGMADGMPATPDGEHGVNVLAHPVKHKLRFNSCARCTYATAGVGMGPPAGMLEAPPVPDGV